MYLGCLPYTFTLMVTEVDILIWKLVLIVLCPVYFLRAPVKVREVSHQIQIIGVASEAVLLAGWWEIHSGGVLSHQQWKMFLFQVLQGVDPI